MLNNRRASRRASACALAALLALVLLPSAADAALFCVNAPPCLAGERHASVQSAINAADLPLNPAQDTIRIGPGEYEGPFLADPGNPVTIDGAGPATRLIVNDVGTTALSLLDPASEVRDLQLRIEGPALSQTAMKLAGTAFDVTVANDGAQNDDVTGVEFVGAGGGIDDSRIALDYEGMQFARGVHAPAGTTGLVNDTDIAARTGVVGPGTVIMRRSSIVAQQGIFADDGAVFRVSDTTVQVPGPTPDASTVVALLAHDTSTIEAEGVSAHSTDSTDSYGAWARPASSGDETTIELDGSVLEGFETVARLQAATGSEATVDSHFSAWDDDSFQMLDSGQKVLVIDDHLDLEGLSAGFVDPANGDLHPRHDSPLVDAGDPAASPASGDADGNPREVDGDGDGGARTDIGAFEYQRRAPAAVAAAAPAAALVGEAFALDGTGSSDPDPGDGLSYAWTFDDGGTATGATSTHAFATAGPHSATLTVTDPTGQTATATTTVTVLEPPPPPPPPPAEPAAGGAPPPPPPAPPTGAPLPATVAPAVARVARLDRLTLAPRRFRARPLRRSARRAAASARIAGRSAQRPPIGTSIRFRLTIAARVTFTVERRTTGRRVGRTCRAATRALRRRPACVRYVTVGSFTRTGRTGANAQAWDGRLRGRPLPAGSYRFAARARVGSGPRSSIARASFLIAR